jgi:predicted transport protein
VDVSLNREHDNPQLIFESLNSTGLDLSQADLIRNFVLMGLEPKEQEDIYNHYWYPMEQSFAHGEQEAYFDRFMRDYLTLHTGHIPNIRDVYSEFKSYVRDKPDRPLQDVVADVYNYSKRYVRIAFSRAEDKEINTVLEDINTLKVDVAYPFLLELYGDYEQGRLTREEFIEVLRLVESYVFRRAICGIPTNSLNKTFANLSKELDKDHYLESIKAAFLLKDSYRRFPVDEEFRSEFVIKDVYNFRNRNYLLRRLENFDRKEPAKVEDYTIEHILPQNENLSPTWQQNLGERWREVQRQYLHTIGNLTLTGYNSELSDRPFQEKRDMKGGFRESPLRLNRSLANLEHWNEEEIKARAGDLAELAVQVWRAPELPAEIFAQYGEKEQEEQQYTLEYHLEGVPDTARELFEHLRKRILNLDASVKEVIRQDSVAYRSTNINFVRVKPRKDYVRVIVQVEDLDDPKGLSTYTTKAGELRVDRNALVKFTSLDQLDDVMDLIRQAFEAYREDT